MTKEEFCKRWGMQSAEGYGNALFDRSDAIAKDLEELLKSLEKEKVHESFGTVGEQRKCDSCGCHPNVLYVTDFGSFCQKCWERIKD